MTSVTNTIRKKSFFPFLKGLIQVILNPRQGWLDAYGVKADPKSLLVSGLVPFLSIVALTSLLSVFYRSSETLTHCVLEGVVDFTAYFVSVFITWSLLLFAFRRWNVKWRCDEGIVMTFVVYTIGSMAVITFLQNVMPVELALLSFLPFYVIYIMFGAMDYLGIRSEDKDKFIVITILCLFIPPYIMTYLLGKII